jgi:fructosamine-3-kinase
MLHSAPSTADGFGHVEDNWIGSLPQSNRTHNSWADFWAAERIGPQLERARKAGACSDAVFDHLLTAVPDAVAGVHAPALLHGDLWSGNVFPSAQGRPVLIDPAVYRGDGEVDLAMTELFGGFDRRFYDAYAEVRPISDAYESHRRALYQLYYLLVHVNLFGGGYEAGARAAASRVVSAVR